MAMVLSFFVPGLGHMYTGKLLQGLFFLTLMDERRAASVQSGHAAAKEQAVSIDKNTVAIERNTGVLHEIKSKIDGNSG